MSRSSKAVSNRTRWIRPLIIFTFTAVVHERGVIARETEDPRWVSTGNLNTTRDVHTATLLPGGKVLVTGGYTRGPTPARVTNTAELYDPAGATWNATGNMTTSRAFHTATLLQNGKALVAGGSTRPLYPFGNTETAELYDLQTGIWSATGNLSGATSWHTATLLQNGKVLVAGGWGGDRPLRKAELYDPETGVWNLTGNLNLARFGHVATLLADGKVLITGGSEWDDFSFTLASAELYDPDTGTWSRTGSLNTSRAFLTATLLPDGRVLAAGGYSPFWQDGWFSAQSAELYDPASGTWNLTGQLKSSRYSHTATLLPGNRVLVAGGHTATSELYDGFTREWSQLVGLGSERSAHTATALLNGKVLIAGGSIQNDSLNSTELFDAGIAQSGTGTGVGTRLLIPLSAYSEEFVSSLAILNVDREPNDVTIHATNHLGGTIGAMSITLGVGERFRTANILQQLGAAPGSSGPIVVSSNNGRSLSAVSGVSSSRGGGGTVAAVNLEPAWTHGFLLDVADSGSHGMPGTHRTNVGLLNTSATSAANVTMTLFSSSGQQVGNPLTISVGIDSRTGCSNQINTIVQRLRGSAGLTEGYIRMSSTQPIIAWASKIENGTDDPSFQAGVGAASSDSQESRSDVGTRLLVASAAYSDVFASTLVVLNMDSQPNSITITAYDAGGNPLAPPLTTTLPVAGQFRSSNILQQLGAALGSFGPIKIESSSNQLLSAVSEVKSSHGFSGFFPAVNVEAGWTEGFILEAMDWGSRGTRATYRTNLGLNGVGPGPTNVSITLFNDSGQQVGNPLKTTVAANGLTQLDHIVERLRGSAPVTEGYLRIVSSQPIIAWASKIDNGTNDPSIQLGIGASVVRQESR